MGLDAAELIMDVEDEFKVDLADQDEKVHTVGELQCIVLQKISASGRVAEPEKVLTKICDLISRKEGISVEKLSAKTRFVEDLGY